MGVQGVFFFFFFFFFLEKIHLYTRTVDYVQDRLLRAKRSLCTGTATYQNQTFPHLSTNIHGSVRQGTGAIEEGSEWSEWPTKENEPWL